MKGFTNLIVWIVILFVSLIPGWAMVHGVILAKPGPSGHPYWFFIGVVIMWISLERIIIFFKNFRPVLEEFKNVQISTFLMIIIFQVLVINVLLRFCIVYLVSLFGPGST